MSEAAAEQSLQWTAKEFVEHISPQDAVLLKNCELKIGLPLYPARRLTDSVSIADRITTGTTNAMRFVDAAAAPAAARTSHGAGRLLDLVREGRNKNQAYNLPFLSPNGY